ncbi:MAG: 2-oxo acid dehydrogenase subunit E2 [Clostridia bacterium]|nr:2-oxo acid dehydrogenase subunit E2 [Clostridia bacterium]
MNEEKTQNESLSEEAPLTKKELKAKRKAEKQELKRKKKENKLREKDKFHRVRGIAPYNRLIPYIMETRNTSQNFIFDSISMEKIDKYIKKKQEEGLTNLTLMHVIIGAYCRACSQRPAINRFIRGQKIYSRRKVEVSLAIKKEMSLESPDTVIKVVLDPSATIEDVYNAFNEKIEGYRSNPNSSFDKLAKVLNYIPGILLRWAIRFLRLLDYFGLLPRALTKLSPFHGSLFITSMGSLGIPPIVHHLYDFGTVPVFIAFGSKQREFKVRADGSVYKHSYVDVTYNLDERICDGYYYASAMKVIRGVYKNPEVLDNPPEKVIEDIR